MKCVGRLVFSAALSVGCSTTALSTSVGVSANEHAVDGAPMPPPAEAPKDAAPDSDADPSLPPPHPKGDRVRFVVLGDGGTGDAKQLKVARAVGEVCDRDGCDFALYLGDNIYEVGVNGVDDPQFQTKFEEPYAELDFPFYVVLGNHDYGSGVPAGTAFEVQTSDYEIEYSAHSDKWNMPAHFYVFERGPAAFFALDSNAFVYDFFGLAAGQQLWLDRQLARSDARWRIAFGHHPYVSNGPHGNAGDFDGAGGRPGGAHGLPFAALVEHSLCGQVQVYFAGHDHHREWLEPTCGTTFIVSGAAAKVRPVSAQSPNPTRYKDGERNGFLWVEIAGDTLTGVFYDDDAVESYRDNIVLPPAVGE